MKKLIVIILVLILISLGMLFYFKSYYPALPIDSVSKREVVKKGKTSNDTIIKLTEENSYEWYISKMDQGNANEQMKQMMDSKGWVFKEQMGAGFFFEKESEEIIVVGRMWTGKYVIFQIPKSK